MKILDAAQIRECDKFTIENEPIASIDLMERAGKRFAEYLMQQLPMKRFAEILVVLISGLIIIIHLFAHPFYRIC